MIRFNALKFTAMILLGSLAACSTQPVEKAENKDGKIAPAAQAKKHIKHKMRPPQVGVISVDVYQDGKAIHLLTGVNKAGNIALWHQKTLDSGMHWSKPVKVKTNNAELKFRRGNDAQISARGDNIVIAWMNRGYDNHHGSGPMNITYSHDGGSSWVSGIAPTDIPKGPHAFIELASNKSGTHLVWLDSRLGNQGLFYTQTSDGGATWSSDKTLDKKTCACCWNTMKTDNNDQLYIVYRDKEPSDMALIKVSDNGEQKQRAGRVGEFDWDFDGCPHVGAGLAIQETETNVNLHALVGTGKADSAGMYYLSSKNGGEQWGPLRKMGKELGVHGDIAATTDEQVLAVWDMGGPEGMAIYAVHSKDNGVSWSKDVLLSNPKTNGTHPRVVAVDKGFLVFWTEISAEKEKVLISKRVEI